MAVVASGQCLYCGKAVPGKVRPSVKADHDAAIAAAFAQLDAPPPRSEGMNMVKWIVNFGALGLGALICFALLGPCMRG